MIIVGAKGLAKEVLDIFHQRQQLDGLYFFDDLSKDLPALLYDRFPIFRSHDDVVAYFQKTGDRNFALGLGTPLLRHKMMKTFKALGGICVSAISPRTMMGAYGNLIEEGVTILDGVVITNGVKIGRGTLINPHCSISHDAKIGSFVEMAPGSRVTGGTIVGDFSILGTNAVILPRVTVGSNVYVGAGAVVREDVSDNCMVAGVPAKMKKSREPLTLS